MGAIFCKVSGARASLDKVEKASCECERAVFVIFGAFSSSVETRNMSAKATEAKETM